jgi:hypothetical protein
MIQKAAHSQAMHGSAASGHSNPCYVDARTGALKGNLDEKNTND